MRNFYWSNLKEDLQEGKYICTFETKVNTIG